MTRVLLRMLYLTLSLMVTFILPVAVSTARVAGFATTRSCWVDRTSKQHLPRQRHRQEQQQSITSTALSSSPTSSSSTAKKSATSSASAASEIQKRRKSLLSHNGPYFQLDSSTGNIEFGTTINLVTTLEDETVPDTKDESQLVLEWLSDEKRVATSIWDETLIEEKGNSIYQLKVMKLQFVSLQLQPSVDVKMWTAIRPSDGAPVFYLQSVGYDPNVQVMAMTIDAETARKVLNIRIEVVGQLAPDFQGGVTGKIAFRTSGTLPPPLRLLPESILKAASESIHDTIAQFAIQSFQTGAREKFRDFRSNASRENRDNL